MVRIKPYVNSSGRVSMREAHTTIPVMAVKAELAQCRSTRKPNDGPCSMYRPVLPEPAHAGQGGSV